MNIILIRCLVQIYFWINNHLANFAKDLLLSRIFWLAINAITHVATNTHLLIYDGYNSTTYGEKIVDSLDATLHTPMLVAKIAEGKSW